MATTAEAERHGIGIDLAVVEPHQAGNFLVVGGCAEGAADGGAVEDELQCGDHGHGGQEHEQGQDADVDAGDRLKASGLERAGVELPAVGGEDLQQPVLQDHREAEGHQQRRQDVLAQRAVENAALQPIAEGRHHRHDDQQRRQRDAVPSPAPSPVRRRPPR